MSDEGVGYSLAMGEGTLKPIINDNKQYFHVISSPQRVFWQSSEIQSFTQHVANIYMIILF